ncbi:MAG: phenylalanine--tRNA ligase subunit beta [Candidatus Aenigmarchaeota archaeon]
MPTIDVSHPDLCKLMGEIVPKEKIKSEGILFAKGEVEADVAGMLKLDMKDTNRPDHWSAEGVAREMAGRYKKGGLPVYKVERPKIQVRIESKVQKVRPLTVCAVIRGIEMTDDALMQMIQLQEKISVSFGKNRKEVAIGVYDLKKITSPIRYTTTTPTGIRFIPLEMDRQMTPKQILEKHPKGKEYAHLLKGQKEYPIFIDAKQEVLSMPPIINSDFTGKVTKYTRDLFIECSGFSLKFLMPALNTMVAALADRGGMIEGVEVVLPSGKKLITPDMSPKETELDVDYANRILGLNLTPEKMARLLEQARYEAKPSAKRIKLRYPAYRQDIMHQVDIIEDIIISYGYNKVKPEPPRLATIGSLLPMENFSDKVANLMAGLGCQEILSYILTNKDALFSRMNLPEGKVVEIENIVSSTWCVFRDKLLPNVLEFLSKNRHVDYPQSVYEIGDAIVLDSSTETRTRKERKLAFAVIGNTAGFEDAVSILSALLNNLGVSHSLKKENHKSHIPGRCASLHSGNRKLGFVGEVHPLVLEKWGLEKPVAAFEIDVGSLMELIG